MRWLDELTAARHLQARADEALHELRLAQDLIALREKRGFTQSELAARLGVSQPAIAKIESGRAVNLQLKTLVRFVTALGGTLSLKVRDGVSVRAAVFAASPGTRRADRSQARTPRARRAG